MSVVHNGNVRVSKVMYDNYVHDIQLRQQHTNTDVDDGIDINTNYN